MTMGHSLTFYKSIIVGMSFASKFILIFLFLLLVGCAILPDDEASLVLEDLAARGKPSRLKERTPDPVRRSLTYRDRGRRCQADLYLPGQPPRAGIVLVPGVAALGRNDPRLVAFAITLSRARFLVLVPDIPNLRAIMIQPDDVQTIAGAFAHLVSRSELPAGSRTGIGAFSYAAGPAILAALDPAIRERVDFVLGIGGYYNLRQVITFFTTGYFRARGRWRYLKPNRYGKWVFVLSNVGRLTNAMDQQAFRFMAERRLKDPDAPIADLAGVLTAEGQALFALLENRDPERTPFLIAKLPAAIGNDIEALNLANHDLSRLRAKLILPHGTDDEIIPYSESVALAAAVPAGRAQLFLIAGLAHVDILPRKLDRRALWRAINALLGERGS
ncbi:MAG: alpha/beta hydrolase [Deltaproteobacteria bacterium]|nr:alpha/beta hydrolase [Deltaproteobacteria bacterium]